jgi:hypothetical protein
MGMVPPLPETPDAPPIALEELIEIYEQDLSAADQPLALALLGFLDCKNVEAHLQQHDVFDRRAPLSLEALDDKRDLPEYLQEFLEVYEAGAISDSYPFDALWRAYFTHLVELAEQHRSSLLRDWASFEITLRDALARQRAEALGLKADLRSSGVAVDGGDNHASLLSTLAEASDPMERERLLDRARLSKLESISGIDPFSTDAALAYLAAILILDRWDVGKPADVAQMLEVFA